MKTWTVGNGALTLRQGDLTLSSTDAIVNAANSRLAGGGGVDGAIHKGAGHGELQELCQAIIRDIGELQTGKAVITPGLALPAKHIIHTVGPIWRGGDNDEPRLLASAYKSCLLLANLHSITSIAFPAISCGSYGFPIAQAAVIALNELKEGLKRKLVSEVHLVLHGQEEYQTWVQKMEQTL